MNKSQKIVTYFAILNTLTSCVMPSRVAQPAAPAATTEAPKAAAPTEAPKVVAPTEAPKAAAPTEAPKAAAPTEAPKAAAPTEAPKAAAPAATGDVVEVNIKMSEFKFELDKTSIPAGKTIRFNIENVGQREHEVVLELPTSVDVPLEANGKEGEAADIAAGAKTTLEWVFDKPGKYLIGCHLGKHFERGMKLEIEVTA